MPRPLFLKTKLIRISIRSKTRNLTANRAPAQSTAASAAPRHLSSPPLLVRTIYPPASMRRRWWDWDPTIAPSAGRAIASSSPGRRTAIPTVLLVGELRHSTIPLSLFSLPLSLLLFVPCADKCLPQSVIPYGSEEQDGPSQIKILITNHCPDCSMVTVDGLIQGHFDINDAPGGWNNPKIYYMQLDDSECS